LFFLFLNSFSNAQFLQESKEDFLKRFEKSLKKINDSLYACSFECTLNDYRFFIQDLKLQGHDVAEYLPDTATNLCGFDSNWSAHRPLPDYSKQFLSHPACANYPIRAISKEAALAYCRWLTEAYQKFEKAQFRNVSFVLPSENEWVLAAYGLSEEKVAKIFQKYGLWCAFQIDYPWLNDCPYVERNKRSKYVDLNTLYFGLSHYMLPTFDFRKANFYDELHHPSETEEVNAYKRNKIGLYCMCGNVSEMTRDSNVLKGGSFILDVHYCSIKCDKVIYFGPSWDVGFRVFMKTN
jgi:formylglycine-generating enzyme required for sulfatase activity